MYFVLLTTFKNSNIENTLLFYSNLFYNKLKTTRFC